MLWKKKKKGQLWCSQLFCYLVIVFYLVKLVYQQLLSHPIPKLPFQEKEENKCLKKIPDMKL